MHLDIASLSKPVWEGVGLLQLPCILAVIDHTILTYKKNISIPSLTFSPKDFPSANCQNKKYEREIDSMSMNRVLQLQNGSVLAG